MTEAEIYRLAMLPPEQFERQEWVALAYARDWTLFEGRMPDPELVAEFERLYPEERRRAILAWITAANFANRFNNTYDKPLDLPEAYEPQPDSAPGPESSSPP